MPYTAKQVSTLYKVSVETVRVWCNHYQEFLSPSATPQPRRKRLFSVEDMQVLDLIATMRNDGFGIKEIKATLHNGERGTAPTLEPAEAQELATASIDKRLMLEIERLQFFVKELQQKLDIAEADATKVHTVEKRNVELETIHRNDQQIVKQLRAEIKTARTQINQITREVGKEYNQGFKDGLDHDHKEK